MNILHLKYVSEIGKTGSLKKAAEKLYVAQPNLSRALKELEDTLGITVFKRTSRGMVATLEGEDFLKQANAILAQIEDFEAMYREKAKKRQQFSISVPRASYISDAFVRFSSKIDMSAPAELFYQETNALHAINNILDADYHLGIIRYAENFDKYFKAMLDEKGLSYELIAKFRYILIMSRDHPLASKSDIFIDDLKLYTEIAHADPFVPNISLSTVRKQELPDEIDKRIYVFERSSQFELLCENKDTFMWVSPVPEKLLERYTLIQRPCHDNVRVYRDMLIYRKDYLLTDLDKIFISELFDAKRRCLDNT